MKRWCIINLGELYDGVGGEQLEKKWGPTLFYDVKSTAILELFRLHLKHPGEKFVLFESIAAIADNHQIDSVCYLEEL